MQITRIQIVKKGDGTNEIWLRGRDNAGNVLQTVTTLLPGADLVILTKQAVRSIQALASEFTEEENFKDGKS